MVSWAVVTWELTPHGQTDKMTDTTEKSKTVFSKLNANFSSVLKGGSDIFTSFPTDIDL